MQRREIKSKTYEPGHIESISIGCYGTYNEKPRKDDITFSLSNAVLFKETWRNDDGEFDLFRDLEFKVLLKFESPHHITVLDLTWMRSEDIFCFDTYQGAEWESIKEFLVNIDNLGHYSRLPSGCYLEPDSFGDYLLERDSCLPNKLSSDVKLVVFNCNSDLKFRTQINYFEKFVRKHAKLLSSGIKLVGFPIIRAKRLERIASKYGVPVVIRVPQKDKENETFGHGLRKILKKNTPN